MFIRKKKNSSGSTSIQILQKKNGRNVLIKSIGSAFEQKGIAVLIAKARQHISLLNKQQGLFISQDDAIIESFVAELSNAQIRTIGPELVFGRIYDHIGYGTIDNYLFRHLVIARLAFPLSKLKTIEYLYRFQGVLLDLDSIYRFLDKLNSELKEQVEQLSFEHTRRTLNDSISIVFYDMATLYFEASNEDDLRKAGFSKDGKHSNPQIFLGLLVGLGGYAIGYDIFEGNIFEGHTLLPFIEAITRKFHLIKPIIVADSGLLNNNNIAALEQQGYEYILGAESKMKARQPLKKYYQPTWKMGNGL